jgi:hypothetical protein
MQRSKAERLSSVSGGDDDDSDGIELGHGGGVRDGEGRREPSE